ncbi:50S ribosomal protein L4 [Capnocytophaga canimorsus]|uniref:Large ribosomal subunit protein uL4 n=2 Tax=Capnocytophaga canimorsus TaxID=28188 RepID=F9YRT6_CAPCC|nr:50S ribosomal protein L4 [Capnocytophaga canimorsus]AEK22565.1 50S ribosomal protein L4 [Capnocytophaga canimorsus Cc5]ATA77721.1 50S ribosomal protein L4 [Capnocytophaga canimorsus]ATA92354.1 50S ribosomal protein L4 [Capnocytophaga canimorsus]ATA94477.1 50S ribosomal protein L4 [Capnocytophaga canimorsus]AWL79195.1 50S ribosomal protein L4 [Capnocytophaga canimorsus]
MEVAVLNNQGKETGRKITLSDAVFAIEPNNHVIYLDVKRYLANKRQGTHKAKERNEVAGSTRKIKKQKGTGTARAGSVKSPVFVGGGRIFGPRPKDYTQKLNKNVKRLARRSALSLKAKEQAVVVLEDFNFDTPKTKEFVSVLKALGLENKKSLFVLADINNNVYLSSRNLKNTNVVTASELNTYDIMNASGVVLLESSVDVVESNLTK